MQPHCLSLEELARYERNITNNSIGINGQKQLKSSSILTIGCGGIASVVLPYLVAAGIGHLTIVDFDTISISNLQRQIMYKTSDIGTIKVDRAEEFLLSINNNISIKTYNCKISNDNPSNRQLFVNLFNHSKYQYDLVIDVTDNFNSRSMINQMALTFKIPLFCASARGTKSYVYSLKGYERANCCYNCMFSNIIEDTESNTMGVHPSAVALGGSFLLKNILNYLTISDKNHHDVFMFDYLLSIDIHQNIYEMHKIYKILKDPTCYCNFV